MPVHFKDKTSRNVSMTYHTGTVRRPTLGKHLELGYRNTGRKFENVM